MSRAETETLTHLTLGASLSRALCTIAELGRADRWARRFTVTLLARQSPERESIFGAALRKISPIREWRCVLAVLILVPAFQPCVHAQQVLTFSPKVLQVLNTPPLKIKGDEDPLVRLKKERFNAALNEAKARFDLYKRGLTKVPHLIEVGERLFGAEVDLYDRPEDRARVLQRQLDVYNEAEGNLERHVREGLATQIDLERLRYDKASLEIDLLTAKSDLSQPRPTPRRRHSDSGLRCFPQDPIFAAQPLGNQLTTHY